MPLNQIFQSSYSAREAVAYLGMVCGEKRAHCTGKVARGLLKAGYGCFKAPVLGNAGTQTLDPGEVFQIPSPDAAADVDAIKTSFASSASIQTFLAADLNGVVGDNEMAPGRFVTLVLSSHTDWDATTAVLTGVLASTGQTASENLAIPAEGNATVTSVNRYISVTSLVIPAQTGTGGTATVGVSALPALTLVDFLGFVRRTDIKSTLYTSALYGRPGVASGTDTADYCDNDIVPIVMGGEGWVFTEEAVVDRDPVYVRVASGAGGSVLGAFRNDSDSSTCVLVPDARFVRDTAAGMGRIWMPHNG